MENIRQTLETLEKPKGETKYGGQCKEFNSVKIRYSFMTRNKIRILFLNLILISRVISNTRTRGFKLRVVKPKPTPKPTPNQLLTPIRLLSQAQTVVKPKTKTKVITWGPVHNTAEKFENATINGHFGFVYEQNADRESAWKSWSHRFRKAPFSKYFLSTLKHEVSVIKKLRLEERTGVVAHASH